MIYCISYIYNIDYISWHIGDKNQARQKSQGTEKRGVNP